MNRSILVSLMLGVVFCMSGAAAALDDGPVAWWSFDDNSGTFTKDGASKISDSVVGKFKYVDGVKGKGLRFDGFTTNVRRRGNRSPKFGDELSVEAWVVMEAYPWNWCPVVAQEKTDYKLAQKKDISWPETISADKKQAGYYFGIGPRGQFALQLAVGGKWYKCVSKDYAIALKKWAHIAATYDAAKGVVIYLDGKEAGRLELQGSIDPAMKENLMIGMNRQKRKPSHPVRPFATLPAFYSIDGVMDEIKMYDRAVSGDEVASSYSANKPAKDPEFAPRRMPSGPKGPGKFGAYYSKLKYYEQWDAHWPVGEDADIVVQFDDSPVRVVFWRGMRYSPAWVMENGFWMGDQSVENFNGEDGCIEHMLDPHCEFSHVRIIENSDARVVVQWRYYPTSANGNHSQVNETTGWGDWVDEYYTFYPDGVGLRKVVLYTKGRSLWPEEVIALCHPGQRPEDVVDLAALTLVNLKGKSKTYTWAEKSPKIQEKGKGYIDFGNEPGEKPNIIMINMKSKIRPFQIFEKECSVRVFGHEHRKNISHFPWWNHWPAGQALSDGRYCQAADRAAHFSLAWGGPPPHMTANNTYWWAWMYGASDGDAKELVPLAKSWSQAPGIEVAGDGFESDGYDMSQRAYLLARKGKGKGSLRLVLDASSESPVVNPAFVITGWGDAGASLTIDGKKAVKGKDYRIGHRRKLEGTDLIVWVEKRAEKKLEISLVPVG